MPSRGGLLGLGSNVGDRRAHLQAAVDALPSVGVRVTAASSVYDTDPVGEVLDQPSFLNACVLVETSLEPFDLLDAVKGLEAELGRAAGGVRHGPRAIDIDVLLLGDLQLSHERMTLPHEQVLSRALRARPRARARLRARHARRPAPLRRAGRPGCVTQRGRAPGRAAPDRHCAEEGSRPSRRLSSRTDVPDRRSTHEDTHHRPHRRTRRDRACSPPAAAPANRRAARPPPPPTRQKAKRARARPRPRPPPRPHPRLARARW